ncbi:symmetrical bis(5'-nucleosyl)-tetraphosphatase [Idiomarina seosinensis]|uniref:symmetrical bis(5'-nucleosyl)-tetraphosphatase n=1 Tax=Idiomarina seosinensis TaxID=281739 RepID=UPI00384BCE1D
MSLYIVGDVHGCYKELMQLLDTVGFSYQHDTLWCVGDIIARGPDSLAALQFFVDAPEHAVRTVLGNHDLNLLGILAGQRKANPKDRLDALLNSRRRLDWLDWIRQQPLFHFIPQYQLAVTHAGFYPWWSLTQAKQASSEVEQQLKADDIMVFLKQMFGNQPTQWDSSLSGYSRYRFIVNAFTRMRFCHSDGRLDFSEKGNPEQCNNKELTPWYQFYQQSFTTVFGHWAALMGETDRPQTIGLDTGCVWGNYMTLWDVERDIYHQQSAIA